MDVKTNEAKDRPSLFQAMESEKWAGILMENANDAIFLLGDGGVILETNREAENLLGYSREWMRGRAYQELICEESLAYAMEKVGEVFRYGKGAPSEVQLKRADGNLVWLEFTGVLVDLEGEKVLLGIGRDITDRRRNEEEMARLASIVANSGDAICGVDLELRIESWNRGAEEIYGYSAGEILGHRIHRLVPAKKHPEVMSMLQSCREGKVVTEFETSHLHRASREVEVSVSFSPVLGKSGQVTGFSMIARDIRARKKSEEALREKAIELHQAQKMEVVGRLAGGVAHDFNNVLSVVLGNCEMMLSEMGQDDVRRNDILDIQKAGLRGAELTKQLLLFSRKQTAPPRALDLNDVVRDLNKTLGRMIGERVELRMKLEGHLGSIQGDPLQVQQIIMNLVINSYDAMPRGGVITLETRNEISTGVQVDMPGKGLPAGNYACLKVTDTGCGMDRETQKRIFEPFFTTKPAGKGTGLGLSIVFDIVKQLNGKVEVESEVGKGTTFKISLPVCVPVTKPSDWSTSRAMATSTRVLKNQGRWRENQKAGGDGHDHENSER